MRILFRRTTALLVALALSFFVGCGSGNPTVYPVTGKVTYGGKPLPGGGTISFVPVATQAGKTASGEIGADGSYRLTTYSPGDGSMAGDFRVVIQQTTVREPDASTDGGKVKKAVVLVAPVDQIPLTYADHFNSPLKATVEAKGANNLDFDIPRK